ncbi:MAG: TIM-barrel domain-containing protein [Pseudomonadota bacterium]
MLISSKFSVRRSGSIVELVHVDNPLPVLRINPGDGCITAGYAEGSIREVIDSSGLPRHGHYPLDYCVQEKIIERFESTETWKLTLKPIGFEIKGVLKSASSSVNYTMAVQVASEQEVCFRVTVESEKVNRVWMRFGSPAQEYIFGLGEQFSFQNLKGHRVPLYVMEKGIGRGLEPLTSFIDLAPFPAPMDPVDALVDEIRTESHYGTHSYGTYIPVPFFLSNLGRGVLLDNTEYSVFDFSAADTAEIGLWSHEMWGRIFVGATPRETLESYTAYAGRMHQLPEWMIDGMMIGAGGGSAAVRRTIENAVRAYSKLGIPVTSVNIHDWQGRRTGDVFIPSRLWWTFEPDATLYADWEQMVKEFRDSGIRVIIYFNPMIASEAGEQKKNLRRDVFKLAEQAGYLVRKRDGTPYIVSSGIVKAGFIDLTNPDAREWMKDLMKEQVKVGVSGWMSDFAEGLPHDAVLFSGEDAATYHNRYPVEYAKLNREVLVETGMEDEINFHSRSGYAFSSKYSTGFFTGDQLNTWDDYGGFKTTVNALISGGLSGIQFFIYTYGGFWTIIPEEVLPKLPEEVTRRIPGDVIPRLRADMTPELRARRLELVAFGAYAMIGVPEPDEMFGHFATLVTLLASYRKQMGAEAAERGVPLIRHMMLEFPADPAVYELKYQYMYGSEFLFRPVVDPGVTSVSVYLPAGTWVHLFTQQCFGKKESGEWVEVDAPVGKPAVFFREGSQVGEELMSQLQARGIL